MPINLNLSPTGRAKGRKKRLNPLPQALSSFPPAPPAKPLEYLETLSPARLVVRAIRNKESNRDIDHMNRLELLTQSTARINADLLSARTRFAARCIPRTDTPYCNPACGSSVGSEGKPMNTTSNYRKGGNNPAIAAPHDPQFTLQCGEELNSMLDTFSLNSSMHEYQDKRDSSLVAFRDTRNSHLASLVPLELDIHCRFGGSDIRQELAPHSPNPSIPFKNYLRRREMVFTYQMQREYLIHRLNSERCNQAGSKSIQSGLALAVSQLRSKQVFISPARITVRQASKAGYCEMDEQSGKRTIHLGVQSSQNSWHDGLPLSNGSRVRELKAKTGKGNGIKETARALFEHDVTTAELSDIESASEDLKANKVHQTLAQSTARMDASELSDNWLMVSRDLSDKSVTVHSASTMKSAEWKAQQVHLAHPNTVNAVVSRAQALSARWDSLFAAFEEKHASK